MQYLAVATFPTSVYSPIVSSKVTRPFPASIQIWSYGPDLQHSEPDPEGAHAVVKLEMAVCIESGPAMEIKWCPLPSHDVVCSRLCARFVLLTRFDAEGVK